MLCLARQHGASHRQGRASIAICSGVKAPGICLGNGRLANVHGKCASMRCVFSRIALRGKGGGVGTITMCGKGRCISRVR